MLCTEKRTRKPLLRMASRKVEPSAMAKGQTAPLLSASSARTGAGGEGARGENFRFRPGTTTVNTNALWTRTASWDRSWAMDQALAAARAPQAS